MMLKKEGMKMKKRYVCRLVACPNCFGTGIEPGYGKCIVSWNRKDRSKEVKKKRCCELQHLFLSIERKFCDNNLN